MSQISISPNNQQGLCIWFTGLSGAGKTTTANALAATLEAATPDIVTVLDGDIVREHLSSELGFSREDRDINVKRIGYVASLVVKHGGIAVCSCISPYRSSREAVRRMFPSSAFMEAYVATPLQECENRDTKGLYLKAREGIIPEFTGITDPYEPPVSPELVIDTMNYSVEENVRSILRTIASFRHKNTAQLAGHVS